MFNVQAKMLIIFVLSATVSGFVGAAFALKLSPSIYSYPVKVYPKNDEAGRMLSVGETIDGKWHDYIIFKKKSRLYPEIGHPAIVFNNIEHPIKTFELGFYKYGPTLVTNNEIVEFWIGDSRTGAEYSALSLRSLHAGFGAQLHVRNHADTHSMVINNHDENMVDYEILKQEIKYEVESASKGNVDSTPHDE